MGGMAPTSEPIRSADPGAATQRTSFPGVSQRPGRRTFGRGWRGLDWRIDAARAATWLSVLAAILAAAAATLHVPGQLSMDTSIQLEEARVGRSLSFNPPFMSALFRWLGGGEIATSACVLFCCLATYGGLAVAARAALARRTGAGSETVPAWRVGVVALLLLDPVLFIHVGIVWKDVLFAAVLMAGSAAAYAAWGSRGWTALAWAIASWVLLAVGMDVRQQGVFMSPCLALAAWGALAGDPGARRLPGWGRCAVAVSVFLAALFATRSAVRSTIVPADDKPARFGYQVVMTFDLAGMVCASPLPTAELAVPITDEQRAAVRASHASDRIDKVVLDPVAAAWLSSLGENRYPHWLAMVRQNPLAYARHRLEAFGHLLGFQGIAGCLPLCSGSEGNTEYLERSGIPAGRDARDLLLYRIAAACFDWPIYRHWFWLLLSAAAGIVLWRTRATFTGFAVTWPVVVACLLLFLSYLPTAIACDFRYLFPAIPLGSLAWSAILLGGAPPSGAGSPARPPGSG